MSQTKRNDASAVADVIDRTRVLELYLGAKRPKEIAEELSCSPSAVNAIVADAMQTYSLHLLELSEQIAMVNMGRLEHLVRVLWDRALQGDERAIRSLVDVMKLEMDWSKHIVASAKANEDNTHVIERIEKTFTSSNDLYTIALDKLRLDMDSGIDMVSIDDLYSDQPPVDLTVVNAGLADLEKKVGDLVGEAKDDHTE